MIVVMKTGASQGQIQSVEQRLKDMGFGIHSIVGTQKTVIGAIGEKRDGILNLIEDLDGVEKVVPILQPYKLAGREFKKEDTVITVGGVVIGAGELVVAAGPCAVEGEDQILEVAKIVKAAGANILRGGAYKPRTSPYSFQGLELEGLKMLQSASQATGLPIITEIVDPKDVELVGTYADILQVGARNMQNFTLLKEIGKSRKPVMLKRGLAATVDEWLMAAEYILSEGNYNVILCERGIRTYETATRNTLDLSAVSLLKSMTHLPIFVDPSHATGKRQLVSPMSKAAVVVGADGLIIEVHPNPAKALSDGAQSLEPEQFMHLMDDLRNLHSFLEGTKWKTE